MTVTGSVGSTSVVPNLGFELTRTLLARSDVVSVGAALEAPRPGAVTAGPAVEVTVTTSSSPLAAQPDATMAASTTMDTIRAMTPRRRPVAIPVERKGKAGLPSSSRSSHPARGQASGSSHGRRFSDEDPRSLRDRDQPETFASLPCAGAVARAPVGADHAATRRPGLLAGGGVDPGGGRVRGGGGRPGRPRDPRARRRLQPGDRGRGRAGAGGADWRSRGLGDARVGGRRRGDNRRRRGLGPVVQRLVDEGWSEVAPLSGIPGSTGATPVQNVGRVRHRDLGDARPRDGVRPAVGCAALDPRSGSRAGATDRRSCAGRIARWSRP